VLMLAPGRASGLRPRYRRGRAFRQLIRRLIARCARVCPYVAQRHVAVPALPKERAPARARADTWRGPYCAFSAQASVRPLALSKAYHIPAIHTYMYLRPAAAACRAPSPQRAGEP
jgi:hypothetical protein